MELSKFETLRKTHLSLVLFVNVGPSNFRNVNLIGEYSKKPAIGVQFRHRKGLFKFNKHYHRASSCFASPLHRWQNSGCLGKDDGESDLDSIFWGEWGRRSRVRSMNFTEYVEEHLLMACHLQHH